MPLQIFIALLVTAFVASPILLPLIYYLVRRTLRVWQDAVLKTLATAMRSGVPLGPALRAFGSGGFFTGATYSAAQSIELGAPPHVALSHGWLLSSDASLLLASGAEGGNVTLAANDALEIRPVADDWNARLPYLVCVMLYMFFILTFVMIKVVPAYIKIFEDFDARLPVMTILLIEIAEYFVLYLWPMFAIFLALAFLYMLIASIGYMFGYRMARFPVRWLRRRLDTALLLRSVRIMMAGGKTMPDIFLFLAERFPAARFRRRLERAVVDVETGVDWNKSLLDHRLIRRSDAAVLAAAQRVGNVPWALGEVAASGERRFWYRRQLFWQTAFPLLVLGLGLTVAFIVIALFVPALSLIWALA